MHFTDWIIAGATVGSVGVAGWYTYITRKLLLATKESVGLTEKSLELNREIYFATHRPILGIDIQLEVKNYPPPSASLIPGNLPRRGSVLAEFTYTVKNYGSDRATEVSFQVSTPSSPFCTNVAVGDVQPGEEREISPRSANCQGAIVKSWHEDIVRHHHIDFVIQLAYTWRGKPVSETVHFVLTPDGELINSIEQASTGPQFA